MAAEYGGEKMLNHWHARFGDARWKVNKHILSKVWSVD